MGHRPAGDRRRLLPAGLGGRSATSRRARSPFGCEGDEWYEFDPEAARALLAEAGFEGGFETKIHLRDVVRGYLPLPKQVAADIQAQLAEPRGHRHASTSEESTAYLDNANAGRASTGIHLLGWGADYPDATNFLDFHFGSGASPQFGDKFDDITGPLATGASSVEDADRQAAYEEANNAIQHARADGPDRAWRLGHGLAGGQRRRSLVAARQRVDGRRSRPGADGQLVWMQNAEPGGLYCADETDGECAPRLRADHGGALRLRGRWHGRDSRRWPRSACRTRRSTSGPAPSARA